MNYLEIIKNVLANGTPKVPTRVDNDGKVINLDNNTTGTFCEVFRHDMSKGFPLTTLRKMPWRSIRVELEGFIKGVTDKSWYQKRGCKFWDEWANPIAVREFYDKSYKGYSEAAKEGYIDEDLVQSFDSVKKYLQMSTNDLGPIYGYQWRHFDGDYNHLSTESVDKIEITIGESNPDAILAKDLNGVLYHKSIDQLKTIIGRLKNSPYDRRMVCSAWNPNQMHMMALPPCHWGFNVVVYGNKLNLVWHQRSCDLLLGVGANIASYGLLLLLLAEEAGLEPGELVGTLADCHIYDNLMDNARELVKREENTLPAVKIKRKSDGSFSIFDWTWDEVEIDGYDPHPAINMGGVTV